MWQFRCTVNMFWVQLHFVCTCYRMITFYKYQKIYWSVSESMGMFCWTLSPNRSTCFYRASIDILVSLLWILDWQPWFGSASNSIYIEYEYSFLDLEFWNNSIFPLTIHMYQTVEVVSSNIYLSACIYLYFLPLFTCVYGIR